MLSPSKDEDPVKRDDDQRAPRTMASGSGPGGKTDRSKDPTSNVFTSLIELRDNLRLPNTVPLEEQRKDKLPSTSSLSAAWAHHPHELALSGVPRFSGPGPPQFPSSSAVFPGGTLPTPRAMTSSCAPGRSAGPSVGIKRSPKVKIFQKKERSAPDMLSMASGLTNSMANIMGNSMASGSSGRGSVIHNGLRRVTVETTTPQVVYEPVAVRPPAMHRHLPNVSAHLPVSSPTVKKKSTKKSSSSSAASSSSTSASLTLASSSAPSSSASTSFASTSSSSAAAAALLGSRLVFYPYTESKALSQIIPKAAKTQHIPPPAHSRPPTPAQASMLSVSQKPVTVVMDATPTDSAPLDLSCDSNKPVVMAARAVAKSVSPAAASVEPADKAEAGDSPLDLSVKKRPLSTDGRDTTPEPALKKQAVEVVGVCGKMKFTRPVSPAEVSLKQRQVQGSPYVGITFGKSRAAPVGIATATTHPQQQERQVEMEPPRVPRPAHLPPPPPRGMNTPPTADLPAPVDSRTTKDMTVVGRRSPILPGGPCTVTPSLSHSEVVNVRGKPFKVSTVRPQVNGRPVITTRSFPSPVTTTSTVTMSSGRTIPTSSVTFNGTIGAGPLGCLQLSSIAVHGPPLTAEAPTKLCDTARTLSKKGPPGYVVLGSGSTGMELAVVATQRPSASPEVNKPSAGAESSEDSESACQAPLLNIPRFKPSKSKTKSKKSSRPPLVIDIPDQINASSSPLQSSSRSLPPPAEDPKPHDTHCVSISTQTMDESQEEDEEVDIEEVVDFPPPDEPVDLKELYPTPSRTLMCARKSTTKQSKRLLQQILESRSPPKLSVISPAGQKAAPPSARSSPPHMPTLSPHRSPPTLVPQALPKVKPDSSLDTRNTDSPSLQPARRGQVMVTEDCDRERTVAVNLLSSVQSTKTALNVHKEESTSRLTHSEKSTNISQKSKDRKSSKKTLALQGSLGVGIVSVASASSSTCTVSTATATSLASGSSVSSPCSNSSVSLPSSSLPSTSAANTAAIETFKSRLLAKILVSHNENSQSSRDSNSPGVPVSSRLAIPKASGSHTPSSASSESEESVPLSIIRDRERAPVRALPNSSEGANIFEKFQALAEESRDNFEDCDELSLMCWEQMAASPPGDRDLSPGPGKSLLQHHHLQSASVTKNKKDNVHLASDNESSNSSTNSVIAKALPKVNNISAFMPTNKTELTPLHYATIRESISVPHKRTSSPVPIENTRFYQANILRGSLSRSTSSPALETLSSSKPGTPRSLPRSSSSTPQPDPVFMYDDLEDWQVEHINYQRTKLRRPRGLLTVPKTLPKGTVLKRLSPEGLYDYCPSAQYGKAKACMTGESHTPVFTPTRNLSTTTVHGLARLATMDFSNIQPRSARTVAEYNRARAQKKGQEVQAENAEADPNETWTMVKEVSPRKPGSPAAARGKESSGTLVTVLRRERSRDDSGSSTSKSPIQYPKEKWSPGDQPIAFSRPVPMRSESDPGLGHSPASASSSDADRPKLTLILSDGKHSVKISHGKKKSKSSKPEKHRHCTTYTIKGDPLEAPPAPRDPTSPQPKLSPIRLVASPPRRRKSAKKSESSSTRSLSPPGSPKLTFVSTIVRDEPSTVSDNATAVKTSEEPHEDLKVVFPKRPKIKIPELKPESSVVSEKSEPMKTPDSDIVPLSTLKIRVDQGVVVKRALSPIKMTIKSPPHMAPDLTRAAETDIHKERNALYDLPTSPEMSPVRTMFTPSTAELLSTTSLPEAPPKKKEKKASKKHKKDKKRDGSKEKSSKLSEGKKEKKEKKNREKDREKDMKESSSSKEKSSKKREGSKDRKDKSEKREGSEHRKSKSEKREGSKDRKEKCEKREGSKDRKDKCEKREGSKDRKEKCEKREGSKDRKEKCERREGSKDRKEKCEKREGSKDRKEKCEKREGSKDRKDKFENIEASKDSNEKCENIEVSEQCKEKCEKRGGSKDRTEKCARREEIEECKEKCEKKDECENQKEKGEDTVEIHVEGKSSDEKKEPKDTPSKKKESKKDKTERKSDKKELKNVTSEDQTEPKDEPVQEETQPPPASPPQSKAKSGKSHSKLKSGFKKKIAERHKLRAEKRRLASETGRDGADQRVTRAERSLKRKLSRGKQTKAGLKKSRRQREAARREEEERLRRSRPKRRSLLDELTNSDGYVAEKRLEEKKCTDLYADPSKLGREERALLRAMMRFSEMEQTSDPVDQAAYPPDQQGRAVKEQTSARRKAQALTKSALRRARNKGGCTKKPKFDDFVPEILSTRTRRQAAELAGRKKKQTTSSRADKLSRRNRANRAKNDVTADVTKGRRRERRPSRSSSCPGSATDEVKSRSRRGKRPAPTDGSGDADHVGRWEILSGDDDDVMPDRKPVVPPKRRRPLVSSGLTMKIQWKAAFLEYAQNQRNRKRGGAGREPSLLELQRRIRKSRRAERQVKEEPSDLVTGDTLLQEAGSGLESDAMTPLLEDFRVKQEPLEMDTLGPLLRPDPMAAPSPAPSTSTGLSAGGTEEYWPVPECVKKMSVNQNTGETILHKAARLGYEDVARFCAQTDYVDLDARDHAGYTAMHECCSQGHLEVSTLLIEGGASVNLASCDGMRPLHDAVENDLMEMVRLLLSRGADPKLATYSGKTVLGLTKQKDMLAFLTGYFQDLNGCRQPQPEIPWSFNGSSVCDDPDEETGFDAVADTPNGTPDDDIFFEFSDTPPIQTYFLPLDPVKGATNYVSLDDVAERLGLTRDIFLKEYTSLPIESSSPEFILTHCQCLGTDVVSRLHQLALQHGPLKLIEYSDVIQHLLETDSQRLQDVRPEDRVCGSAWTRLAAGESASSSYVERKQPAFCSGDQKGQMSSSKDQVGQVSCSQNQQKDLVSAEGDGGSSSKRELLGQPSDMDCFDWNEQFEQLSQSASSSETTEQKQPLPVTTSSDIYRGLFVGGTDDETEEEENVDELYLTAMGLDEGTAPSQERGDTEKKEEQEIFFRKPY